MKPISSLSAIVDNYDLLLLDLWGVVHDGTHLYPDVLNVITRLHSAGKKIIFISNAPRRAKKVVVVLEQLGVSKHLYDFAVSSGEVGFEWLASGKAPQEFMGGKHYYYIGPLKDHDVLDGLEYTRVQALNQADFLVNVGFGTEEQSSSDYLPILQEAQQLTLPMLCLNPDLEVVKQTGERFPCAGVLARQYKSLGGEITWFGKPYAAIYDYCMSRAGNIPKTRWLAIGDSLETDIAGGLAYGIDTMLITGGILHEYSAADIQEKTRMLNALPHFHMPQLRW